MGEKTLEGPDILLRNVLVALSRGASSGDALLTAQRGFLRTAGSLDALELKSYAQLESCSATPPPPLLAAEGARRSPTSPNTCGEHKEPQPSRGANPQRGPAPKTGPKATRAVAWALPKGTRHSYDHQPAAGTKATSLERTHVVLGGKGAGRKVVHVVRERDGEVISRKRLRRS